jgi:hypothetical protein
MALELEALPLLSSSPKLCSCAAMGDSNLYVVGRLCGQTWVYHLCLHRMDVPYEVAKVSMDCVGVPYVACDNAFIYIFFFVLCNNHYKYFQFFLNSYILDSMF